MKPEILHNDHMMFLDRALETQRTALLTAMADAVSECRTAADQAAELTETGEIGLLRLVEILCAAKVQRGQAGGTVLEGTEVQILADVVAQLYACLTECRFVGPLGLAAYAELSSMAASLMLGEWLVLPSSRPRRSRKRLRNRSWTRTPRPPSWTQRARRSWRNGKLRFPCSVR